MQDCEQVLKEAENQCKGVMKDIGTDLLKINFTFAVLHILNVNICKHKGATDICHSTKLFYKRLCRMTTQTLNDMKRLKEMLYGCLRLNLRKLRCLQVIGKVKMASAETWNLNNLYKRQNRAREVLFLLLEISLNYNTLQEK